MTVTQYIGARYVPLFADPIEWDITKEYEPLTIVYWQGNSYTSRQAVPANIDISNNAYWALTGNYNAQIEQYRSEVKAYDQRISSNAGAISKETKDREDADLVLDQKVANVETEVNNLDSSVTARLNEEKSERQAADTAEANEREAEDIRLQNTITTVEEKIDRILPLFDYNSLSACFLGDSITMGQDNNSSTGRVATTWPDQMSIMLKFNKVDNIAVGGATAANHAPAPSTALKQAQVMNSGYDLVFLMFGTNDYGYEVDLGYSTTSSPATTTMGGLAQALEVVFAKNPNAKVIGVIPPYMPGDTVANGKGRTALQYKTACKDVYQAFNMPIIDFTYGLGWNAKNWDSHLMSWDVALTRLHPNQASYIEMGNYAARIFPSMGEPTWFNPARERSAKQPTLNSGSSWAIPNEPAQYLFDQFTGYFTLDLGGGIKCTPASNNKIAQLDVSEAHPYREFIFACVGWDSSYKSHAMLCAILPDGTIQAMGDYSDLGQLSIMGTVTIPYWNMYWTQ